jgi:hypothetical protein
MYKFFHILIIFLLAGCSEKRTADESLLKNKFPEENKDTFSIDCSKRFSNKWNDLAEFMAGNRLCEENEYYIFTEKKEWDKYHCRMDSLWNEFLEKICPIKTWQQINLPGKYSPDTIFYPFSGPDIPYVTLFYPEASYYYLFAMEPAGSTFPSASWIKNHPMENVYEAYFKSISLFLSSSFFRTNDMKEEFSGIVMDGVLPVLLILLKRMDYDIFSVSFGKINNQGNFTTDPENIRAIEIKFGKTGSGEYKRICYVSCNLSNRGISEDKPLQALFRQQNSGVLIKSASYLMHNSGFSRIKNLLLRQASIILQDDSGIPYQAFLPEDWHLHLYGYYSEPIFLFRRYFQQDLADAYTDSIHILPMDFRIGYGTNYNLLIAKKKDP